MDVEFAHEVELVRLNRFDAELEIGGDFLDGFALGEHFEDFALALGAYLAL